MKKTLFVNLLVASIGMFSIAGCKKDSPVTLDSIPPTLEVRISGGGFNKTFTNSEDYSLGTLNLKSNTKYTVSCVLADTGGVRLVQITLPKLLTPQNITGAPTDTVYNTARDFSYRITKDESDPYKSFLLSGNFVTPDAANGSFNFSLSSYGKDFRNNRSNVLFNCSVDNNPVGGFGWVLF